MNHLNPDELIDAMEGLLAAERQAHLATCDHCRQQLDGLSSALADTKLVSVPEPSPLFWQHFSERVRTAIDDDAAPGSHWPSWLRWQVLAPVGALALVWLALMIAMPKPDVDVAPVTLADAPPAAAEDSWVVMVDLVGELDLDTAFEAGVIAAPGLADRAVLELTADEQQELARLLKAELTRAKS